MTENYPHWLSNQMIKGVRGFNIDAYLVALEGWRRGLELTWYYDAKDVTDLKIIGINPLGKTFSLSSKDKTHFFYRSRGDQVTNESVEITSNKDQTKDLLTKGNVPNPQGIRFMADEDPQQVVERALIIGFPLVIKPTFGSLGKGVVTNIQSEESLRELIVDIKSNEEYDDFIIEEFVSGYDLRVYVVNDQVAGATKRVPANITADGVNSIGELIKLKNKQRKQNPHLATKLIEVNEEMVTFLKKQELTLDSIPDTGVITYLTGKSNISAGGDSIDYTDFLGEKEKQVAIDAVKAISGLTHAGVDLVVDEDQTHVIEINATADIMMHILPLSGSPRNIPAAIIDYYFPETIGMAEDRTKIYFDYRKINNLLRPRLVQEVKLRNAPEGKLYAKRYVVSGKVQKVGYRNWIRKEALKHDLNGYTRNLKGGKVVVVVAGEDKELVSNFKKVCLSGPSRAEVAEVREYNWESQIKLGFEIRRTSKS